MCVCDVWFGNVRVACLNVCVCVYVVMWLYVCTLGHRSLSLLSPRAVLTLDNELRLLPTLAPPDLIARILHNEDLAARQRVLKRAEQLLSMEAAKVRAGEAKSLERIIVEETQKEVERMVRRYYTAADTTTISEKA